MTPEELVTLKHELGKLSDELTKRITQYEEDLKKLGLGVQTWVVLSDNTSIGYQKVNGQWRIVVGYLEFGEHKELPLTDANRGLRIYCYKHFDRLVEGIEKGAITMKENLEEILKNA